MLDRIGIIAWKETVDNLRDRRSVSNALMAVLLNPLLYIFLFGFLNRSFAERAEQALPLPIVGADNAPNLIAFLEQNNVDVQPAPTDPEAAVRAGEVEVVLVIPAEYGENFENGRSAPVQLLVDESNQGAQQSSERAEQLLQRYSTQITALRLLARGISPEIITAVTVQQIDVSPDTRGGAGFILNLLPTIMMTAAFFGGFYLIVDMTAGERERESLEPLLINPVPRNILVLGKFAAGLFFTVVATILATATFPFLLQIPQIQEFTGLQISLSVPTFLIALLLIFPVVIMAVAIEMFIASYAKSVKDAQNYVQVVALIGFLPSIFLSVLPIKAQFWMNFIPTVAQVFLISKASRGEILDPLDVAVSTAVTLGLGIVALVAAIWMYNQERIVLGK